MDEFTSRSYPFQEHMRFQRRSWMVERIGWLALTAISLTALTGLFGTGVLSARTLSAGPLTVSYERFQRVTKLAQFDFRFADGGERRLHLNAAFRDGYEIVSIQPQPVRAEAGGDGMTMTFAVPATGGSVKLWAHPRRSGLSRLQVRTGDETPLAFSVFVYP